MSHLQFPQDVPSQENAPYMKRAQEYEERVFYPKASFSTALQRIEPEIGVPSYKLDVERIIHSKAYARYADKTQVVYLVENDHITHRSLHVQLVSCFARHIAAVLQLNQDLVEAISLGHDVGHPPFGHEGEGYLSALSQEYGNGPFMHSLQSCRLFTLIEPLNLALAVHDGFLCHDGGMGSPLLLPARGKTWESHLAEQRQKQCNPDANIIPGTLEGCLVKICDTVSYLAKDIEDAIRLGIVRVEEVPSMPLGKSTPEILHAVAQDLIKQSFEKDVIALSQETFDALHALRRFNFEKIYKHPKLKVESSKICAGYRILFEHLLHDFEKKNEQSYIWKRFLQNKSEKYVSSSTPVQKVIDYIAGMTDHYFVRTLQQLIVPGTIEIAT
jgi:dGTPase